MTQRRYELTAAARLDLLQLWIYLAEQTSVDVADRVLGEIERTIESLIQSPGLGHRRVDLSKKNVLFYRVYSYLIVYRRTTTPLHIVRILHAARHVKRVLRKRSN